MKKKCPACESPETNNVRRLEFRVICSALWNTTYTAYAEYLFSDKNTHTHYTSKIENGLHQCGKGDRFTIDSFSNKIWNVKCGRWLCVFVCCVQECVRVYVFCVLLHLILLCVFFFLLLFYHYFYASRFLSQFISINLCFSHSVCISRSISIHHSVYSMEYCFRFTCYFSVTISQFSRSVSLRMHINFTVGVWMVLNHQNRFPWHHNTVCVCVSVQCTHIGWLCSL